MTQALVGFKRACGAVRRAAVNMAKHIDTGISSRINVLDETKDIMPSVSSVFSVVTSRPKVVMGSIDAAQGDTHYKLNEEHDYMDMLLIDTLPIERTSDMSNEQSMELPTDVPTEQPTEQPTDVPIKCTTDMLTEQSTEQPTDMPMELTTDVPMEKLTDMPLEPPTDVPTEQPTDMPPEQPTDIPTEQPTDVPPEQPTDVPTEQPTDMLTDKPKEQLMNLQYSKVKPKVSEMATLEGEHSVFKDIILESGYKQTKRTSVATSRWQRACTSFWVGAYAPVHMTGTRSGPFLVRAGKARN